jgi:PAS domain S-box-containing protein
VGIKSLTASLRLTLACVLLLAISVPGHAAQPIRRSLLFLGNHVLPPMIYINNEKPCGLVVDLGQAIANRMHSPVECKFMDWGQAQAALFEGHADALIHINPSIEREPRFAFSSPLVESEFSIFAPFSRRIDNIRGLWGLRVGVEEHGLPIEILRGDPLIKLDPIHDVVGGFRSLQNGELDAVVVDRRVGEFVMAENGIKGIRAMGDVVHRSYSAIAVRRGENALLTEINNALSEIKLNGTYEEILAKWEPSEIYFQAKNDLYKQRVFFTASAICLVVAVAWGAFLFFHLKRRKRVEERLKQMNETLQQEANERKQTEDALRQSRQDLDRAQAVGQIGWWRLDTRRDVLTWSSENHRIFGVPEGTPMSYGFFMSIVHPDDRQYVDSQWLAGLRGEPYDIEHRIVADGGVKWVREKAYLEFDSESNLLGGFGVTQDITTRKNAEEALRASESQYHNLFTNMAEEVHYWEVVRSKDGRIQTWRLIDANPPTLKTWGRGSVEEIRGKTTDEIFGAGATEHYMGVVEKIFAEGAPYSFEDYFPNLDRHFRFTSVPLGNHHFITTGADITSIKKAQEALRRLNESLESKVRERTADLHAANQALEERAAQLRALAGELTTVEQRERKAIAKLLHDGLQQYLVAARMRQSALIEDIVDHAAKKHAQEVEGLLSESINVSRSLAIELCPPGLDGGILAGLEWLTRFMASRHGLDVDLITETKAPSLAEDVKVFLFESVRELLLNVVKHSKVLSARVHLKDAQEKLRVIVSDSGAGFEVLALQASPSAGGFGLFSIRERIGLVGGSIEIDSSPGNGARFILAVPIGQHDPAQVVSLPPRNISADKIFEAKGRIRILLADDHKVVREGLAQMLGAEADFEIVGQAENGDMAVELAEGLHPDIVLMDINMPNMDGITATRIIAQRHPDVHVVGLSIYLAEERADEMMKAGAKAYVSKTAPAEELKQTIRSCIGGKGGMIQSI